MVVAMEMEIFFKEQNPFKRTSVFSKSVILFKKVELFAKEKSISFIKKSCCVRNVSAAAFLSFLLLLIPYISEAVPFLSEFDRKMLVLNGFSLLFSLYLFFLAEIILFLRTTRTFAIKMLSGGCYHFYILNQ